MWRSMRTCILGVYVGLLRQQLPHGMRKSADRLYPRLEIWLFEDYLWFQDCPCDVNCPNGCNGCPNPICVCGENPSSQNEDNLQECKKEKSIDLGQCIIDCNDDQSCEQSCVNFFKVRYDECPCQVKKSKKAFDFRKLDQDDFKLRMIVHLDAHAMHSVVNPTKSQF